MAALAPHCCMQAFSSCSEQGLPLVGMHGSHCSGFSGGGAQALGAQASGVMACGLSSVQLQQVWYTGLVAP